MLFVSRFRVRVGVTLFCAMSVLAPCAAPGIGVGPASFYSAAPPAPPQAFYQHIQHLHRNSNIGGDIHYWSSDTCGAGGSPSSDCALYDETQSYEDDLYGPGNGAPIYQQPQLHTLQSADDFQTHQLHNSSEYCTTTGYHRTLNSETGVATLTPYVRVVKRRNTANKKERRRTQSINNAYADLRDCIPNVPVDTKLSKIKTLRLASSYIGYLMGILESGDPGAAGDGFRAELLQQQQAAAATSVAGAGRRSQTRRIHEEVCNVAIPRNNNANNNCNNLINSPADCSRAKGRTGWPQHVWALELKQEQL